MCGVEYKENEKLIHGRTLTVGIQLRFQLHILLLSYEPQVLAKQEYVIIVSCS